MKKIPIYGLPLNPLAALEELAGRSFCVSFANKRNVEDAIRLVGADGMLMVDNGAFTIWRAGGRTYDLPMLEEFEAWAADILERCPHAVAVVPDVIGGSEEENLELIRHWWLDPERSMVVWHLNESIEHLVYLCEKGFAHVGFGSAGDYAKTGTPAWHARISEALAAIDRWVSEGEGAYVRPRLHLMRGLSLAHLYPFDSSDSTNVARNHNRHRRATGNSVGKFAARIADKIAASAGEDTPHPRGSLLEHLEHGDARLYELAGWFHDNYSIERREPELPFFAPLCGLNARPISEVKGGLMMTDYLTAKNRWGETVFDMAAFAKDLAAELGGKVLERDPERTYDTRDDIEVDGVRIWLTVKGYGAGKFAKVHVWAARPADGLAYNDHPYGDGFKMPDAWVTATRPMKAIAKDVRRRVVEAAKAPIAKWAEHAAAVTKRGEDLAVTAERLRNLGLTVRLDNGATRTGNLHGFGLYGEFYADGSVNLRSMNLGADAFEAVVAALATEKEDA